MVVTPTAKISLELLLSGEDCLFCWVVGGGGAEKLKCEDKGEGRLNFPVAQGGYFPAVIDDFVSMHINI